ncbi:fibroblast growth factor receptor 1-like [Xenia sp. Carnegie-2017]|uniref:fibroblast growth factor receptor 1-like n=1 Tax=Xenia sp. Carnegie-2017 TaxID=2897299 RepID=UPI001F04833C|nr:fibroblast growth factor receptor 1-like [Xenia sp. Carnegie-2017]
MVFVCSKPRSYGVVFFLMSIFVRVFSQFPSNFFSKETGTQQIFKCDVSLTGDSTVKFTRNGREIIPSDRIKVNGTLLIMSDLKVLDSGQYSCIFDGKKPIVLGFLNVRRVKKYKFTIYPEDVTSKVTEGSNFEFRCEYEKGSTKIKWLRRRRLNGTEVEDYVPENLITVRTTPQKSVEVYHIPRVSINDTGVYRCEVDGKNNRKILSKLRILEVIERRAAKFTSVKNFFHFIEADKAEITLYVEEFPFPNITCYKEGKEIIFCIGKKMKDLQVLIHWPANRINMD